jgi:hypothetical protein
MRMSVQDKTASDKKMREGLLRLVSPRGEFMVRGQKLSRKQVLDVLDERLRLAAATISARHAYRAAVRAQRAYEKQTHDLLTGFRLVLRGQSSLEQLLEYGLALPKKRRRLTAAEKVAAATKARATRAARKAR